LASFVADLVVNHRSASRITRRLPSEANNAGSCNLCIICQSLGLRWWCSSCNLSSDSYFIGEACAVAVCVSCLNLKFVKHHWLEVSGGGVWCCCDASCQHNKVRSSLIPADPVIYYWSAPDEWWCCPGHCNHKETCYVRVVDKWSWNIWISQNLNPIACRWYSWIANGICSNYSCPDLGSPWETVRRRLKYLNRYCARSRWHIAVCGFWCVSAAITSAYRDCVAGNRRSSVERCSPTDGNTDVCINCNLGHVWLKWYWCCSDSHFRWVWAWIDCIPGLNFEVVD